MLGWPDEQRRETRFALEIPLGTSLILTHDADGEVRGLEEFAGAHPPVAVVFFAFRIMIGVGLLMIAVVSWSAAWALRRGTVPSAAHSARAVGDDIRGLDRDARGLDHDRGRPPALDRL